MVFIVRQAHLIVKHPVFLSTATEVTVTGNCDQGLLWFFEECNSGLIVAAGF